MEKIREPSSRKNWIDSVKAIAILFVLLAHVDVHIPIVSELAVTFYVPVFFVLAGYLYHPREESFRQFVRRKAKRLLLPYFAYNLFLFLFFFIKGGQEMGIPFLGIFYARNSLYPLVAGENIFWMTITNSPTWFLPALFLTELLWEFLYRKTYNNKQKMIGGCILFFIAGVLLHFAIPILLPWSLESVLIFELFFLAGYGVREKGVLEKLSRKRGLAIVLFFLVVVGRWLNGTPNFSISEFGNSIFLSVVVSVCSSVLLLFLCKRYCTGKNVFVQGLLLIGQSTLQIMCLHLFVFMFLQTGVELIWQDILAGQGMRTAMIKIGIVLVTIDSITILNIVWKKYFSNINFFERIGQSK